MPYNTLIPPKTPVTLNDTDILSVREQIQEDILSYASVIDDEKIFFNDDVLDKLCDIVVSNFARIVTP